MEYVLYRDCSDGRATRGLGVRFRVCSAGVRFHIFAAPRMCRFCTHVRHL